MKKNILILLSLITFTAMAQTKGKFEVLDLKSLQTTRVLHERCPER